MTEKRSAETCTDTPAQPSKLQRTTGSEAGDGGTKGLANEADVPTQSQQPQQPQQPQATAGAGAQLVQPLQVRHALSADKGPRATMEDVHVVVAADAAATDNSERVWHFGLFDGHGGVQCAAFASERLHQAALAAGLLTPKAPAPTSGSAVAAAAAAAGGPEGNSWPLDVKAAKQAITQGFTDTDAQLLLACAKHGWVDGATCVSIWLVGSTAFVANVGDAKCVLARLPQQPPSGTQGAGGGGGPDALLTGLRAVVLTKDHLAMFPGERARITKAGGHVSADGRLNGRIQVSRSFGDAQFKGPRGGSSVAPDVTAFSVGARERFLLCACDGFWSVIDPQGAVDLAAAQLRQGKEPKAVTNRLLNEAVTVRRCKDNCTVLLVLLHP